jgi:hypothetical protein
VTGNVSGEPKTSGFGWAGETVETPASVGEIASRLTMGFGTLCSLDMTIPFAEIDGRVDGFVTQAASGGCVRLEKDWHQKAG